MRDIYLFGLSHEEKSHIVVVCIGNVTVVKVSFETKTIKMISLSAISKNDFDQHVFRLISDANGNRNFLPQYL